MEYIKIFAVFSLVIVAFCGTYVPPKPFFDLITAAYKDNPSPVVITGGSRDERIALAEHYADYFSKDIAEYMLWVNCSTLAIMSSGFYAIAEAYNFTDAMYTTNVYDLLDKVLRHFLPWKALFVLEEADVESKFLNKFFELAKTSNNTYILITCEKYNNTLSSPEKKGEGKKEKEENDYDDDEEDLKKAGDFSVLNYDFYKTRDFLRMIKGLGIELKYLMDEQDVESNDTFNNTLDKYATVLKAEPSAVLHDLIREVLYEYDGLKDNKTTKSMKVKDADKINNDILDLEAADM